MTILNALPSEVAAVVATIDPDAYTAATTVSDYADMGKFERVMFILQVGTMATNATLDAVVKQATDSSGTGAKNLTTSKAITQLTQPVTQEAGKATWKMQASWLMGARLNENEAISLVIGLSPEQARQQLSEQTPIAGNAEIRMNPEWWPRLPVLPFRIKLINLLENVPINN